MLFISSSPVRFALITRHPILNPLKLVFNWMQRAPLQLLYLVTLSRLVLIWDHSKYDLSGAWSFVVLCWQLDLIGLESCLWGKLSGCLCYYKTIHIEAHISERFFSEAVINKTLANYCSKKASYL